MPEFGIRRIQMDELKKLKGLSNSKYTNLSQDILLDSVEQHVWDNLCNTISKFILLYTPPSKYTHDLHSSTPTNISSSPSTSTWDWKAPDLRKNKEFYNQRVCSLRTAVNSLGPGNEPVFLQGLQILEDHRTNYGPEGPKKLVILSWK